MKLSLFSMLLFSLLLAGNLHAQRSNSWLQTNDRGNRHEGTYTRQVSNPSINLVSLIAYQEGYEFGKNQDLKVRFYSPVSLKYQLKAEELRVDRFYWMEDKNTKTGTGWHTFSNWPVDYLLRRLSISYRNLGILVRVGEPGSRLYVPVFVYHTHLQQKPSRYVANFQLGRSASGGSYSIFRGKGNNNASLLEKYPVSRKSGGTSFPILIPIKLLRANAWYTVEVNLREKGTLDPFTYSFSFYHKD